MMYWPIKQQAADDIIFIDGSLFNDSWSLFITVINDWKNHDDLFSTRNNVAKTWVSHKFVSIKILGESSLQVMCIKREIVA